MSSGGVATRPDYGLDAPGVVRNLFLVAAAGIVLVALRAAGIWSGVLVLGPVAGVTLAFPLASMGAWAGAGCAAMGIWMVWSSRSGKVRDRERLLDAIPFGGGERVLDVGCGRGLMLIGAAKRLTSGGGGAPSASTSGRRRTSRATGPRRRSRTRGSRAFSTASR